MSLDPDTFVEHLERELHTALDNVPVADRPWDIARRDLQRERKDRRQRLIVPLAAAATAAVIAGIVLVTQPLNRHAAPLLPPALPPMRVVASATLADTTPPKLTVGGGAVYAALWDSATVVKFDPTTLARVGSLQVGSRQTGPLSIAYGAGAVWVPNFEDGRLWRIDPATMRPTLRIKLPGQASQVAFANGSVWVTICCTSTSTATRQQLLRIDPATGATTGKVTVPGDGETVNLSTAAASVVISTQNAPLSFIDPRTMTVQRHVSATCNGCDSAPGITTGGDSAYVATGTSVTRLSLTTGQLVATSPPISTTTSSPFSFTGDELWTAATGAVIGLDPRTLGLRERVPLAGATEIVTAGQSLLIATGGHILRLARQSPSSQPTPPAPVSFERYRDSEISFDHPTAWRAANHPAVSSFTRSIVDLSNERMHQRCTTTKTGTETTQSCGSPLDHLERDGVFIAWEADGFPGWSIDHDPGVPTHVDGLTARWSVEAPGDCKSLGAIETVNVYIARPGNFNYYLMKACIAGPNTAAVEQQIRRMLETTHFARP